jgi:hypothetical protein
MKRTNQRIDNTLAILAILWKQAPELRLGQLVCAGNDVDSFFLEDHELLAKVKERVTVNE